MVTIIPTINFTEIRVVGNGLDCSMFLDLRFLSRSLFAICSCGEMSLLSYTSLYIH